MLISSNPKYSKGRSTSTSTSFLTRSHSADAESIPKKYTIDLNDKVYSNSNPEPIIATSIKKKVSIGKKKMENTPTTQQKPSKKNNIFDSPILKTVIKERKIESAKPTVKNQHHSLKNKFTDSATSHKRKKFEFVDCDDNDDDDTQKRDESKSKNDDNCRENALPVCINDDEIGHKQTMKKLIPNNYNYMSNISHIYLWNSNMSNIRCFPVYRETDLRFNQFIQNTLNETVNEILLIFV